MVRKLLLAAAALGLALPASALAAEGRWRPIFDGKSLRGWVPKITGSRLGEDPRRTFRVKDGAIRVTYEDYDKFGGRFGHLHYRMPLAAPYRVRFEYRFSGKFLPDVEAWQHSNSGLMFNGQPPETIARDQKFPVSLELQLVGEGGPAPSTANLCTPGTNVVMEGRLVTQHCINSSSPPFANGRWIKVELDVAKDGRITHFVDGRQVMSYSGAQLDPADADAKPLLAKARGRLAVTGGYLSLQSEGHPVEFRNVELRAGRPTSR